MKLGKLIILSIICLLLTSCANNQKKISPEQTEMLRKILEIQNRPIPFHLNHSLSCIDSSQVKEDYTPPDLYAAANECVKIKDYTKAQYLFYLATARSTYDASRVRDETSHKVEKQLMHTYVISPGHLKNKDFRDSIDKPTPGLCNKLLSTPVPNYFPEYMVKKGKLAKLYMFKEDALHSDFDTKKNWKNAVQKSQICAKKTTNFQASGNLESSNNLSCISLSSIKSDYTPADLYPSAAKCLMKNKTQKAIELYMAAGLYARYDMLRITDKSAWQAKNALIMKHIYPLPKANKNPLVEQANRVKSDKYFKASLCDKMKSLPIPTYEPSYMLNHGMGAVLKQLKAKAKKEGKSLPEGVNINDKDSLKDNYDPKKLWKESLKKTGLC